MSTAKTTSISAIIARRIARRTRQGCAGRLLDSKTMTSRYDHYAYDREKRRALDLWNARLLDIVAGKAPESNVVELARA